MAQALVTMSLVGDLDQDSCSRKALWNSSAMKTTSTLSRNKLKRKEKAGCTGLLRTRGYVNVYTVLQLALTTSGLQGDLRGNVSGDDRNAVTWGVFPGQEIIQTTIIERESFISWKVCTLYLCLFASLTFNRMKRFQSGKSGHLTTDQVRRRIYC